MADPRSVNVGWIRCSRKVPYRTRKAARDAASRIARQYDTLYHIYLCDICGSFHLSTAKEKK